MNLIKKLKINTIMYIIFHSAVISDSEEMCINLIQNYGYTPNDIADAMEKNYCKVEEKRRNKNYKKLKDVEMEYQEFLRIWSNYLKSFKLESTIEASLMILYFIEKGYLSSTKKQEYDEFNRSPAGLYYYHVFKGNGVCENYAGVANDILNAAGYESAYMICSADRQYFNLVDHAVCLIKENGSYYLFDPTWKKFGAVNGDFSASTIEDIPINYDLDPYFSYGYNKSGKERNLLENFIKEPNISHYIDENVINKKINKISKFFVEDKEAIENVYNTAKPHIEKIIELYDEKCKQLKDQKRLYFVDVLFRRKHIKGEPLKKV